MIASGNTVLITGGANGIGRALATTFAAHQNTVVICDRDRAQLAEASKQLPAIHTIDCDVTSAADRERLFNDVRERFPAVNVLIHSAGIFFEQDFFRAIPSTILDQEMLTNFLGPVELTRLFLPQLLRQPAATLVTINSMGGVWPLFTAPVYSGTKAGLSFFSRAIRHQLRGSTVRIVEVFPPAVDTQLCRSSRGRKVSPELVARRVFGGLVRGKDRIWIENYSAHVFGVLSLGLAHVLRPTGRAVGALLGRTGEQPGNNVGPVGQGAGITQKAVDEPER